MLKTYSKNNKLYTSISQLKPWDKNPRKISDKSKERLKEQIKQLGQYKPLLVTEEGIVIGGNMRLLVYKELGINEIWISIISFKKQNNIVKAYIDNIEQTKQFKSIEQAMYEYSLSDNDRSGFYIEEQAIELAKQLDVDLKLYSIDINEPEIINDLNKKIEVNNDLFFKPLYQVVVEAENEIEQQEIYNKLVALGYKVKTLTL